MSLLETTRYRRYFGGLKNHPSAGLRTAMNLPPGFGHQYMCFLMEGRRFSQIVNIFSPSVVITKNRQISSLNYWQGIHTVIWVKRGRSCLWGFVVILLMGGTDYHRFVHHFSYKTKNKLKPAPFCHVWESSSARRTEFVQPKLSS